MVRPRGICRVNRAMPVRPGVSRARRRDGAGAIYGGGARPDAARTGGAGLRIVRGWVVRFNAKGFDGLLNGKAPGARRMAAAGNPRRRA